MYVDSSTIKVGDKVYTRHLLRESYREGKTVKHRTIANLSHCSPEEIEAIRLALRHKKDLTELLQGNQVGRNTEKIEKKQPFIWRSVAISGYCKADRD